MFETILLAVDGSEPSNRAVGTALDLATKLGSEVIVMHVRERETASTAYEPGTSEEAAELVDETVRKLKEAGVSARGEVHSAIFGRAARVILEGARECSAGIVVMGSRGLSDLAGLVMGECYPQGPAPGPLPGPRRSLRRSVTRSCRNTSPPAAQVDQVPSSRVSTAPERTTQS